MYTASGMNVYAIEKIKLKRIREINIVRRRLSLLFFAISFLKSLRANSELDLRYLPLTFRDC